MHIKSIIMWIKQNKLITALIILFLFLLPLIIVHLLFNWDTGNDFFYAEWSAGELIGYIAGFEAFLGTVILGIVSVWQNENANITNENLLKLTEENERKSVLPYFSVSPYITKYEGDNLLSAFARARQESESNNQEHNNRIPIEDTARRFDILITQLIYTIFQGSINLRDELTEEQQKKIQSQMGTKAQNNKVFISNADYHYKKYLFTNCGKGSAINVQCRLYRVGSELDNNFDVTSKLFTVSNEKLFDLGIYLNLEQELNGRYSLEITYQDIYSNKYKQTILFIFEKDSYLVDLSQYHVQVRS